MNGLEKYPYLFRQLRLGNTIFRNRIFSAPTGLYDLTPENAPTEDYIRYWERKAKGGCASVNIGECYVDGVVPVRRSYECINLKERKLNRNGLAKVANAISRYGAVPTIELMKLGIAGSEAVGLEPVAPTGGPHPLRPDVICHEMTEEEILQTIEDYSEAALYAKNRGFGMAMVHAGHGWLPQQFFSPLINKRTDRWGGSAENRARFTVAIVDEIHRKCGRGFPVEVRISGSEMFEGGYDINGGIEFAKQLEGHADLIHVSVGNLYIPATEAYTHPGIFREGGCNVPLAAEIKKHVSTPIATIGGLSDPDQLEEILAAGQADVVEMARGLICDPDLPIKCRTGRDKEVRRCLRCFRCVGQEYDHGRLFCTINPESGKDREISALPPMREHKNVLVAGGGIAGMEAALTAAGEGHRVILCEKGSELGGVLLCEKDVPFKKRVYDYILQQRMLIAKAGIDVRLNTPVTPELVKSLQPDVIIAAIGAKPSLPPIPGIDGKNVLTAAQAFGDPDLVKGKAVVIGAGQTGLELAIFLAELGKPVEILEMTKLNAAAMTYGSKLQECKLAVRYETEVKEITPTGILCETANGTEALEADTVILAAGQSPLWDEAEALSYCAGEFYQVGDCRSARTILAATAEAWTAAKSIGRY